MRLFFQRTEDMSLKEAIPSVDTSASDRYEMIPTPPVQKIDLITRQTLATSFNAVDCIIMLQWNYMYGDH